MKKGDIYYADLSPAYGSEQGGKRPVLIVQNDVGNKYAPTVIVAPLTSRHKPSLPTHVVEREATQVTSVILCEQVRTIDKSRLMDKLGTVSSATIKKVDKAIMVSFGITI